MKKRIRVSTRYGIFSLDCQGDVYDVFDNLGVCLGELNPDDYEDWDDDIYSIKLIVEDAVADGTLDEPLKMEFYDDDED